MSDPWEHIRPGNIVLYRFWPYLSIVKIHFEKQIILVSRSGSGSSPKSNQFVLVTHTQSVDQVSSESVHNFLRYRARYRLSPISQCWRITLKILVSRSVSGSSPKWNQIFLATHPIYVHQVSSESVHNVLRYPAYRQTNKKTERGENITSFAFSSRGNNEQ